MVSLMAIAKMTYEMRLCRRGACQCSLRRHTGALPLNGSFSGLVEVPVERILFLGRRVAAAATEGFDDDVREVTFWMRFDVFWVA